ncbi:MAG: peptidylprolyl isomerase, partial [Planctomycetota bacterium]|nr:peptidylprolyl isomerase [Planctomycetota bacterium]
DKELEARLSAEIEIYKKGSSAAWMSYEQHLKSKGSSIARRRQDLKREVGLDKVLGEPNEKDLQSFFKENYHDYSERKVELYHILFKERAKALKVLVSLERGDDFAMLAKQHSKEKTSAKKGGRVGWVHRRGDVPRALSKAAFELEAKRGSFGGPVKTVYGWHLFRINSVRAGKKISLKDLRPRILLALKKTRRVQFMIAERKKAKIND